MYAPRSATVLLFCLASASAADWPQWRGPDRSGRVGAGEFAPATLPSDPRPFWRLDIGGGFSSPVVAGGKLLYLDAQEGKEVAHLVDAKSGRALWHVAYDEVYEDEWGPGPRSTPILEGNRAYVQSCRGEFRCLDLVDGHVVWRVSFAKDFGVPFLGSKANEGTASRRGNNGCPIIDGERIFVPVGSTRGASVVCFNKHDGKVLWQAENDEAAYSSLMTATLTGVKQVIYLSADALMGLAPDTGQRLWRVPVRTDAKRNAATPVIYGDCVLVNSHTIGLLCLRVSKSEDGLKAETAWLNRDLKINISTPVVLDHFLYSQGAGKNLVCVDADTGKAMWSHEGFGEKLSSTIAIGNHLLVVTDRGEAVLVAADPAKYTELSRVQVCGKTWNHPAYSDGRLYVREGLTSGWRLSSLDLHPSEAGLGQ